jgi:exonuclease III
MPIMSHFLSFMFTSKLINSIRNKYDEIKELLSDKIVDLLFIAETKLDQSSFYIHSKINWYISSVSSVVTEITL